MAAMVKSPGVAKFRSAHVAHRDALLTAFVRSFTG
jgi:hypothetical protein